jgi:hypothetical protein
MYVIKFVCPNCKMDMDKHNSALKNYDNKEIIPECMTCGAKSEKFLYDMEV